MSNKIVAIIQARMGSTRLPGKVLRKVSDKTLLEYLIERASNCELVDEVVIATSNNKIDDAIEKVCRKAKVKFFRGSEQDVLLRYFEAACFFNASHIIRLCSDSPLLDHKLLDEMIVEYLDNNNKCDYYSNFYPAYHSKNHTYPLGMNIEIFSIKALAQANKIAVKNYEREHVTPYIYMNPDRFSIREKHTNGILKNIRLTVDEEEDFQLIKKLIEVLYLNDNLFGLDDIVDLYKKNSNLFEVNLSITQKELGQ